MTIREAIAQASADFKTARFETPGLDASLLLAHILNTSRTALIASGAEPLSDENYATFRALVQRRLNGECAAYIIGKKEFRGLEFSVNSSVLVPRPDTETLVEAALEILKKDKPRSFTEEEKNIGQRTPCNSVNSVVKNSSVLDLCTGSGAVAIALKNEMPNLEVHATDISAEAIETAKANAEHLLSGNKIHFYLGDLYNAQSLLPTPYSLIVSNPPYIPSDEINTLSAEVQNEPRLALDGGKDGLEIIARIIDGAPKYLERGGTLLLEADPRQMKDTTILLEKKGFKDIKLYSDLSGLQRVIGGKCEK